MNEAEQQGAIKRLSSLEAERQELVTSLQVNERELESLRTDLESARRQALSGLLQKELGNRNVGFTFVPDSRGSYAVNLFALAGGAVEVSKIQAALGQNNLTDVPTNFLLGYLGSDIPWVVA